MSPTKFRKPSSPILQLQPWSVFSTTRVLRLIRIAWVGHVFLRYGGKVYDCVCDAVGAAESDDYATLGVVEGDVTAGIRE